MNFKHMLDDERAVSPVIGIILMVAITVILAAVIGTFVLGLGDKVTGATAPQATWDTATSDGDVVIAHNGGDPVQGENLKVLVDGTDVTDTGDSYEFKSGSAPSSELTAGNSFTVVNTGADMDGEEVKVVWVSPDDGSTQVLTTYEA